MAIIVPITTTFDPKGLDKAVAAVKAAEGGFNKISTTAGILSASLVSTGRSLTRNVTVPLAALGVVVNKTINDASNMQEAQSKVTAVFGKSTAYIPHCAFMIVGEGFDDNSHAIRAITFVHQLFKILAAVFTGTTFYCAFYHITRQIV